MDAKKLSQIDEALGYDRKINAMVFDIEKKRVARYPDEPFDSQIDADIETTTKDNVNALRVILDNKSANLSLMLSPGMNLQSAEFANSSKELYQVETVVQGYNNIVAPSASNKNQMFIQRTLNMLHELLKQVGAIRKGLIKLINQLAHWIATIDANMINIVVFHFVRCIEVLATF